MEQDIVINGYYKYYQGDVYKVLRTLNSKDNENEVIFVMCDCITKPHSEIPTAIHISHFFETVKDENGNEVKKYQFTGYQCND